MFHSACAVYAQLGLQTIAYLEAREGEVDSLCAAGRGSEAVAYVSECEQLRALLLPNSPRIRFTAPATPMTAAAAAAVAARQ